MNIDYAKVGEILRNTRKNHGIRSLEKLSEILDNDYNINVSRQALGRIENGDGAKLLTLELINALCDIFGVAAGYLLGEIKERDYDIKEACEYTSLSEEALTSILSLNSISIDSLSKILSHRDFGSLMKTVNETIEYGSKWNYAGYRICTEGINEETSKFEEEMHNAKNSREFFAARDFSNIISNIALNNPAANSKNKE